MKRIFTLLFTITTLLSAQESWLEEYITSVPNFPKTGIQFKCYSELLENPAALKRATRAFAKRYRKMNIDKIVGLDARGFIFGTALAYELDLPFVMMRKAGKLARTCERVDYTLEYGTATFEIEVQSVSPGERVLIVDDLLATGGTAKAACQLVERLGGEIIEVACLIELLGLHGRQNLDHPLFTLISIEVDE